MVYLRCLGNGFVLDDVPLIAENPDLRNWSFLWKALTREEFWFSDAGFLPHFRNYRPLLLIWYWTNYHLFGLNPLGWHASIVGVHLIAVWLVVSISRYLTGEWNSAFLAGFLFALTPIHAQAVVWMASSGVVLGTALGLAAFYLIMPAEDGGARNWTAAITLYAGALLCHESAIAFPGLVACYVLLFDPPDAETRATTESSRDLVWARVRKAIICQAPFAVEVLLYLIARWLVLGFVVGNPYDLANNLSNAQAILTTPLVFATYLALLAMPWLTLPNHRALPVSSPISPEFWVPLAAIVLIGAAFLLVAVRHPRRRLYLFCAAWMGVTLAPMMMLHSLYHLVQDMYLYLPSVGWCLLVGDLLAGVARKNALARRLAFGGATAMLVVFALALWRAEAFWHDDVAAARGYVEGYPESVAWHTTLGTFLEQKGEFAQAEREIKTAMSLEPDRTGTIHLPLNMLHAVLGEILAKRGDIDGAELEFRKSVNGPPDEDEVHPTRLPRTLNLDGLTLYLQGLRDAKQGHIDQAIPEITRGLEMMKSFPLPDYGPLALRYIPLAELYDSLGNQEQVEAVLKEVDSMSEGELAAGLAHAMIRLEHSDKEGTERILLQLSDRYPTNAKILITLGELQADLRQNEKALISYQRAIFPNSIGNAHLHFSMAQALHAMGRDREALDQCRLALALAPSNAAMQAFKAQIARDAPGRSGSPN